MEYAVKVALLAAILWTGSGITSVGKLRGDETLAYITTRSGPYYDIGSQEILLEPSRAGEANPVVTALAASHDGKFLAAAGDDHAIRVMDAISGETLRTLYGHQGWIQSLAFAGDSQQLYSAGNDGRVLLWTNAQPGEFKQVIQLPYAIRSLSVSQQQGLLAIGGFADEIVVCDLKTDRVKFRLSCSCRDQRCVRFSPDGMHVLSGGRDGEVQVWRTDSGELVARYREHSGRVQTAAFSADGWQVTSAGDDRRLIRYDLREDRVVLNREFKGSKLMALCLINNDLIAVAGADNTIRLFDASIEEEVAELRGHFGTVAVMSPCGELLASGSFDTTIRIWDLGMIDAGIQYFGKPVSRAPIKMDTLLRIR